MAFGWGPSDPPNVSRWTAENGRTLVVLCLFMATLGLILPGAASLQAAPPRQKAKVSFSDLKAVFICRLAGYFKWPDLKKDKPLRIGVLGKTDMVKTLKKIAATKTVNGHALEIVEISTIKTMPTVEVLFVARDQADSMAAILEKIKPSNRILVIGDTPGLARKGAAINFFTEKGKVKFELNPVGAKDRGFQVSSKLMKLARLVQPAEKAKSKTNPKSGSAGGSG